MGATLVAIDLPGGQPFVDELQRIWRNGDAAFPVDQRLPTPAKRALCSAMRVGESVEPGDALVLATSGSTGTPKGVVLTHDAVAASAEASSMRIGVHSDDHWLACLPLSHVGGLSVVTRALHRDVDLTVLPAFDAAAVEDSSATLVSLVPTTLARIDAARFRAILLGGSRPPADRPANTITTYGMTETGSGIVYDGVPLDGVEIRIDTATSEISVRAPMLLRTYRNGPNPIDEHGWFATGDLGDWTDGRLVVHGRAGELIITGGENVWPEAVEAILNRHPAVAEACVRGLDDPEWGQIVEALVVPMSGHEVELDALRSFVKERHASYMAPRKLTVVDALPRTSIGKLQRNPTSSGEQRQATPEPPSIT